VISLVFEVGSGRVLNNLQKFPLPLAEGHQDKGNEIDFVTFSLPGPLTQIGGEGASLNSVLGADRKLQERENQLSRASYHSGKG
jgi:hypothetical protein